MQISNSYTASIYAVKVKPIKQTEKTEPTQTKSWDNMTPAEQSQKIHQNAMRPLPMLDDRANNILNKILSNKGLNDEKMIEQKLLLEASMHVDFSGGITDAKIISDFNTNENDVTNRLEKLIDGYDFAMKNGSVGIKQSLDLATELLTLYKNDYQPLDIQA
jgi:CRISPR/Cas system-associated protein Cas7 (RAMP superfamily)